VSRGHGRIQRRLLEILEHATQADTFTLASAVYDIKPNDGVKMISEAQLVAVRRALAGLAKEGKVFDCGRRFRDGRRRWSNVRRTVAAN
jgi:hypothetical protein